jgi:hypothetical protein
MSIEVVEIHHPAVRMTADEMANVEFYQGLLGLKTDPGRPKIPHLPGKPQSGRPTGQLLQLRV